MRKCPQCDKVLSAKSLAAQKCSECGALLDGSETSTPEVTAAEKTIDNSGIQKAYRPKRPITGNDPQVDDAATLHQGTVEISSVDSDGLPTNDGPGLEGPGLLVRSHADTTDFNGPPPDSKSLSGKQDTDLSKTSVDDTVRSMWAGDGPQISDSDSGSAGSAGSADPQSAPEKPIPVRPGERHVSSSGSDRSGKAEYRLDQFLAEGGMGRVFVAEQASLGRTVALKELKPEYAKNQRRRDRFLTEAAVAGELEHPNIVPIYDLGIDQDGNYFYSMKRISGDSWRKVIAKKSREENIEILLRVADAVAFAHSRQTVHLDIKPDNVMLGEFGEVLLVDWGLAYRVNRGEKPQMGGSAGYMAPEMVAVDRARIGPHSDLYLLGACLYQVITGKPPHDANEIGSLMLSLYKRKTLDKSQDHADKLLAKAQAATEIPEPEDADELYQIARRAMASEVGDRYAGVVEFQQAIRGYLRHAESIKLYERGEQDLKEAQATGDHDLYARALLRFQDAAELWDENPSVGEALQRARLAYAEDAYEKGNYDLGLSLLSGEEADDGGLLTRLKEASTAERLRVKWFKTLRYAAVGLAAGIAVLASAIVVMQSRWLQEEKLLKESITAEWRRAENEKVIAEKERNNAERARKTAENERRKAENQKTLAELAKGVAESATRTATAAKNEAVRERNKANTSAALAEERRLEANKQKEVAEKQRGLAEEGRYFSEIALTNSIISQGDFPSAFHQLEASYARSPERCGWEWQRLAFRSRTDANMVRAGGEILFGAVAEEAGRYAVLVERETHSGIRVFLQFRTLGAEAPEAEAAVPVEGRPTGLAISPDGGHAVVTASGQGEDTVLLRLSASRGLTDQWSASRFLETKAGRSDKTQEVALRAPALCQVAAGARLAVASRIGVGNIHRAAVCDLRGGQIASEWSFQKINTHGFINWLQWSVDGTLLAAREPRIGSKSAETRVFFLAAGPSAGDQTLDYSGPSLKPGQAISSVALHETDESMKLLLGLADGTVGKWFLPKAALAGGGQEWESGATLVSSVDPTNQIAIDQSGEGVLTLEGDRKVFFRGAAEWAGSNRGPGEGDTVALRGHESDLRFIGFAAARDGAEKVVFGDAAGRLLSGTVGAFRERLDFQPGSRSSRLRNRDGDLGPNQELLLGGNDGALRLYDSGPTGQPSAVIRFGHAPATAGVEGYSVCLTEDKLVTYSTSDETLCTWDADSGRMISRTAEPRIVDIQSLGESQVLFRKSGQGRSASAEVRTVGGETERAFDNLGAVSVLAASSEFLFRGLVNGYGVLTDQEGNELWRREALSDRYRSAVFSADGERVYFLTEKARIKAWSVGDSAQKEPIQIARLPKGYQEIDYIKSGNKGYLIAWSDERESDGESLPLRVLDAETGKVQALQEDCVSATVVPEKGWIAGLTKSGQPRLWTLSNGSWRPLPSPAWSKAIEQSRPQRIRYDGSGRLLTYGVASGRIGGRLSVRVWDLPEQKASPAPTRLESSSPLLLARFVGSNSRDFIAAGVDGVVRKIAAAEGSPPQVQWRSDCGLRGDAAFAVRSSSGGVLALGNDKQVRLVDTVTGEVAEQPIRREGGMLNAAVARVGGSGREASLLALLYDDASIEVRSIEGLTAKGKTRLLRLDGVGVVEKSVLAFSEDAAVLAVSGLDAANEPVVALWSLDDPEAGGPVQFAVCKPQTEDGIVAVDFPADSHRLLIGQDVGRLSVWMTRTELGQPQKLLQLESDRDGLVSGRFIHSGALLTTTGKGGAAIRPVRKTLDDAVRPGTPDRL